MRRGETARDCVRAPLIENVLDQEQQADGGGSKGL
jgi:hypothetical protein